MSTVGKEITCLAMVQWSNGADLVEETIQVQPPKAGEVRIKILGSGVCHTDWSEPRSFPAPRKPEGSDVEGFPVILGHEGGGIVESIGEGVTSVAIGDYVIPLYIGECRSCENCLSQKTNLCSATDETQYLGVMLDGTSRFSTVKDGKKVEILHFMGCSTFSEYTVVPEVSVAKVTKKAPLERVGLLGCGVTTGYGAVHNSMKVEAGATAAVFGLGGVGLSVVMGLKEAGASKIIGVDLNDAKEAQARKLGLTHFVNPKNIAPEDTVEGTVWQTNGTGLDYTFECVGSTKLMRSALECTHEGWGKCCIIGVAPAGAEISAKPLQLVTGKTWTGCAFGGCRGRTQLPKYVEAYLEGRPPFVDEFLTKFLPHTEVNEAFHLMHEGKTLRSVVTFPHAGDAEVAAHRAAHRDAAIIFLHGLGGSSEDWKGAAEYLAGKVSLRKGQCRVVCPTAPTQPISKNNGERDAAWFDVLADWPRTAETKDDHAGIAASVASVHAQIEKLIADGVPADRIIVCGFSQGAVLAHSAVAAYEKAALGGCVMLSGWVPEGTKVADANAKTPVFWGHGTKDEIVPAANQTAGEAVLKAKGIPVVAKQYDVAHDSTEAEFDDILVFIKERLEVQ